MSAEHEGEGFGGIFDIDWFGKINDGIKNASEAQIETFLTNVAAKAAVVPDSLKLTVRNALGIIDPPKGYGPGSVTVMGG